MMKRILLLMTVCLLGYGLSWGQEEVKMKYVYSFEEAMKKAREEGKPVFFNCFADWALPCHGMNRAVFSDQEFADWMEEHFVNLFMDVTASPEGRALAERYSIRFQAHYLVLDERGDIVLRIIGGTKLPEFQEQVKLALSPETSLKGLAEKYAAGDRKEQTLRNYAVVLKLADEQERYAKVAEEYFTVVAPEEWVKAENWEMFSDLVKNRDSKMFKYLLEHQQEFTEHNGLEAVQNKIVKACFEPLYFMANGSMPYDAAGLLDVYMTLQRSGIDFGHMIYTVYDIAKSRGEKKVDAMMDLFEQKGGVMDENTRCGLELSLAELKDLSQQQRERLVAYLTKRKKEVEVNLQEYYDGAVFTLTHTEGIQFSDLSFDEALKKAKEEKKLVFMDCYTTWCGPCKLMSDQVFNRKEVGDYFNKHFINLKRDMEKGEGKDLAGRYNVDAFPTMFLLDSNGNVVYKLLGAQDMKTFLEKMKKR